jgi:hypothetical protein
MSVCFIWVAASFPFEPQSASLMTQAYTLTLTHRAQVLLASGADPQAKNRFGQSAAALAHKYRADKVLSQLRAVLPPKVRACVCVKRERVLSVNICVFV